MSRPVVELTVLGGLLTALMIGALMLHVPGADSVGSVLRTNVFIGILGVGAAAYLMAIGLVLRSPMPPSGLWIVLGVAVVMRAVVLPTPPFLSSDIYRYVWDGQVQRAGINPYRYVPADPALIDLRDPAVFPKINRATYARTIYPPAAQVVFAIVGRITDTVVGMKATMLAFEALAIFCMLRLLDLAHLPRERVLIYAWNPLALWAFAGDGHVDAIAIGLLGLALLCRGLRRDGLAGAVLAAATLVKFLPIVVAPAFVRGGKFWRPALAGVAVIASLYALYSSAGANVLGFLPTYGTEEGLDDGTGFWLLAGLSRLMPLTSGATAIYIFCAIGALGMLALRIARRDAGDAGDVVGLCRDTAILAACTTAAMSPHYPWYFVWLALPSVVAPIPAVIWLSVAPLALYLDPFHERFFWPALIYAPAIALAAADLWRRRSVFPTAIAAPEGSP